MYLPGLEHFLFKIDVEGVVAVLLLDYSNVCEILTCVSVWAVTYPYVKALFSAHCNNTCPQAYTNFTPCQHAEHPN